MGCVYLAKDPATDETKIGWTQDEGAENRMSSHWTSNPRLLLIHEFSTDDPSGVGGTPQGSFQSKKIQGANSSPLTIWIWTRQNNLPSFLLNQLQSGSVSNY